MAELMLHQHANVFPERFPLVVLAPDVGPLVQGDDVANVSLKEFRDGPCLRRHGRESNRRRTRPSRPVLPPGSRVVV